MISTEIKNFTLIKVMKEQLKRLLRKWPALYNLVSKIYFTLQFEHLLELLMGTKVREKQWAGRPIAEGYWDNRDHPSKHYLAERIAAYQPVNSILEVGCASGPNLYLLAKKFPQAQIVGIDINQAAIEYGSKRFAEEGITNVKLLVGQADKLGEFQDRTFDIVFTNAVLIYIGPDKINKVIPPMLRIAGKALVLIECHCFEASKDPEGRGFYYGGNWLRDYIALLKQFVPEDRIRVTKTPEDVWPGEPWRTFGAVIEVIR